VTPTSLTGFNYSLGYGPSLSQPYNLSGTNLTGFTGNITVKAPANYEVSLNDVSFADSQLVPFTSATLSSTTIHVRLKSGLGITTYSGDVTNAGGGATTQSVACSGVVNPVPSPIIVASPGTLSGFSYSTGTGPSASQPYTLSGSYLTPSLGNITVQCLTNYEVSTNNTTFSTSVSVAYTGGTLSATTIYVRLKAGLSSGNYNSETVSNAGGGAVTQNVICSGVVNDITALFADDFNYTVGTLLTANGWTAHSGAGSNPITITSPGLSYSNYAGSGVGNAVTLTGNGEDDNHTFTSASSGTIYASAMINVTSANASGDYFFHFGSGTTTTYNARVFVRSATGGFVFGVCKTSTAGNIQWSSTVLSTGTPHFVVLKYTFVTGTTNDKAELFIDPAVGGSEPASNLSAVISDADFTSIDRICLRQSSTTPVAILDGIRVGQTWASVTPSAVKTLTLTAFLEGYTNTSGTGMTSSPTVTVELHNFTSPYALVESQSGSLNTAGVGTFNFTTANNGTPYYVVVKTWNTVETWSSASQNFTSGALSYNFTTAATQAYLSNMTQKGGAGWCIYSGDVNQDGYVNLTDYNLINNDSYNLVNGAVVTDLTGDLYTNLTDFNIVNNNSYNFVKVNSPLLNPAASITKPINRLNKQIKKNK
jgi:hypothetical protein